MPEASIQQTLALGIQHHQSGRLAEAAQLYQQILLRDPQHADALRLLGVVAHAFNKHEAAEGLLRQAIAVNATIPEYHNDLGLALHARGQFAEAAAAYREALRLRPAFAEAHYNLGNTCKALGQFDEAIRQFREALRLKPEYAAAHNNLGNTLVATGSVDRAIVEFHEAVRLQPNNADTRGNLANALLTAKQYAEAIAEYRAALALAPADAILRRHHADALQAAGRWDEAVAEYQAALALDPKEPATHNNLGTTWKMLNRLDDAAAAYRAALALKADYAEALSNLGSVLKDQALVDEAVECFRRAAAASPDKIEVASNLVYMLHFHPAYRPRELAEELTRWNERFASPPAGPMTAFPNTPAPDRPLRIGWVSPDFRRHPIGRFLLPLFAAHDPAAFEFHAFSDVTAEDDVTHALRTHSRQWHRTAALSHDQLSHLIRAQSIDILIDLTMHMQNSRLPVFARRPAPVQMTYLAYCSSTGMPAIAYRLSDASIEAGGIGEPFPEKPLLLQSYWCFEPDPAAPDVGPLPFRGNGYVTFGNLNNFCKASEPALHAWAAILHAVPNSRLLLHAAAGSHRTRVTAMLTSRGIEPQRCRFVDMLPFNDYLNLYHAIDIALDPFPYGGGTTSCDALWMGVPLVTLAGRTGVGRGGASLLAQLDLLHLIGRDDADYVRRATALAADGGMLSELRATLRPRMMRSRLTNRAEFAADLQGLLRTAWRTWCGSSTKAI